jgi:predicted dienelactone hydrolase
MRARRLALCLAVSAAGGLADSSRLAGQAYDPLSVSGRTVNSADFTIFDAAREREIPIRVYPAVTPGPAPVVLFSHGLGGSRAGNAFTAQHWALRGYHVVALQHPGSDEAVWQGQAPAARMAALTAAANARNLELRVRDVSAVLDALTKWNTNKMYPLAGRLDLSRVAMTGHSFGALTTQAVSGQRFPVGAFTDARIRAAVLFSPSVPRMGPAARAFGDVQIPWLLMTGTLDGSPIGDQTPASRLEVFPALPPGGKYELVLEGAEHSAFTDRALPGDRATRNPNHHRAILAISTAFLDAHLNGAADARAWLDGSGPRGVLEAKDRWQKK